MPRLFIAIDLPDAIRQQLSSLRTDLAGARWVKPAQMHLTLRFIGEMDETVAQAVSVALTSVQASRFELQLNGIDCFPHRRAPRVLWVGIEDNPALHRLYETIEGSLRRLGLVAETHPFAAHITLARFKNAPVEPVKQFIKANSEFAAEPFLVEEFRLYSSTLERQGALHQVLATYPLDTAPAAKAAG
ncbi:MAG: RNA 2',3'-cyclic phosphodiesterase [Abitibacteriaceae bacterium]|nr:RNA 2',3'-cyclic phosphodiesterase [Abditibacteriaceae bacterium]